MNDEKNNDGYHHMKSIGVDIKSAAPALGVPVGMTVEQAINEIISDESIDPNLISDGYHTFGELYDHRITLYIALLRELQSRFEGTYTDDVWRSKAHSDGSIWDGWFILGILKEAGEQITYHLPMSEWDNCSFAEELDKAPEWDGHTSEDVLERLKKL